MLAQLALLGTLAVAQPGPAATQPAATQPAPSASPATQPADGEGGAFADAIEAAHGKAAWDDHQTLRADLAVNFGGSQVLAGTMTMTPSMSRVRIDTRDGKTLLWDGRTAWISPADAEMPRARFHVLTWPYFLALPFKLGDEGANLRELGPTAYRDGQTLPAARLTFDPGVGDAPDDWYVVYRDADDRLRAAAYIVTFGADKAEAEKKPHAIVYDGFETVDGVTLPTQWSFHDWSAEEGVHGDPRGTATLTNLRFGDAAPAAFDRAEGSRELPLQE